MAKMIDCLVCYKSDTYGVKAKIRMPDGIEILATDNAVNVLEKDTQCFLAKWNDGIPYKKIGLTNKNINDLKRFAKN